MSFYVCTQPGCNRKYKTSQQWTKHATSHGLAEPVLPSPIQLDGKTISNETLLAREKLKEQTAQAHARAEAKRLAEEKAEEIFIANHGQEYLAEKQALLDKQRQLNEEQANILEAMKQLHDRVARDPEGCCICAERPAGAAVVPCGHAYFCLVCLTEHVENYKHRGCPYCRQPIDRIMALYQ